MQTVNLIDNDASKITHPRKSSITCWNELLQNCNTLSCFSGRIEKYAKIIGESEEQTSHFDKFGEDGKNCFKGDVAEIFAEYVLSNHGRTWGIYNYSPIFTIDGDEQDTGVDGIGQTEDGRVVTVQIKYGNWTASLTNTRRKLRTFHWTSIFKYKVGTTSTDQMFVFTLAHDINWKTLGGFFHKRLKFIANATSGGIYTPNNNDETEIFSLQQICNNKPTFWNTFCQRIKE